MGRRFLFPTIAALLLLSPAVGVAAAPQNGTLSIQVENDYFAPDNRDRHYTNGLRFEWLPVPDTPGERRLGWSLGQSLFTPQLLKVAAPVPHDRPYAAWLYVGLSLIRATDGKVAQGASLGQLDTLEIDVGVVGPWAGGKLVQTDFHQLLFQNQKPLGWRNQLANEPGLLMSYDHKWRQLWQTGFGAWGLDVTPNAGAELGNIQIDAGAGLTLRFGQDLPADYGPPRIRPGLSGSSFFLSEAETGRSFGWYLFAGAEGRAVAHNIFLDGNSFRTSQHVTKKPFVADLQAGVALVVYGVRVTGSEILRTREFAHQRGNDVFGSLSASFDF